jgi:hypothetical protein
MNDFVSRQYGVAGSSFDGLGQDAVAVIIVDNNQIVIFIAGWKDKAAGLVGVDLAGRFHDSSVAIMGAMVGIVAGREGVIFIGGVWNAGLIGGFRHWRRRGGGFVSGSLVLTCLVEVSFNHGNGAWGVFAEECRGEAWKIGDESLVKGTV